VHNSAVLFFLSSEDFPEDVRFYEVCNPRKGRGFLVFRASSEVADELILVSFSSRPEIAVGFQPQSEPVSFFSLGLQPVSIPDP